MENNINICFVVLHYITLQDTFRCIESIKKMDNQDRIRIVIVDNASPNGSGRELKSLYREDNHIHIMLNSDNVGYSKGNNMGCLYAKQRWNPEFYVVTNNDIVFIQMDFCDKIIREYQKSEYAVLGMDIYCDRKGIHQSPLIKTIPNKYRVYVTIILNTLVLKLLPLPIVSALIKNYFTKIEKKTTNALDYDQYQKNVCLMGACMVFSKKYMEKRKIVFWPETKFYYEEFLLSLWCKKNKEDMIYQPEIQVLHKEGSATNCIDSQYKKRLEFRISKIIESAKIYVKELDAKN